MAAGCARPAGTIFPDSDRAMVWPPPPDPPRIKYLGQIATDADLKPAKSGLAVLAESMGGPALDRGVSTPAGVAVTSDEKLYVTDPAQHVVHIFDLRTREYRTLAEAGDQSLFTPADVAVMSGQVFVTDSALHAVVVYDAAGKFVRSFGPDRLKRPVGIAAGPGSGQRENQQMAQMNANQSSATSMDHVLQPHVLYVVDTGAQAVVIFDFSGTELARFGRRGSEPGEFNFPTDVAVEPGGGIVVADTLNFRVQRFTADGQFVGSLGTRGDGAGTFALPKGVAVDPAGHIYVVDAQFENVQVFSPAGELLLAFGREGHGPGEFWLPNGAAIGLGRLWVADAYNRRVQVFQILKEPG